MAIREIRIMGDEVLKKVCKEVKQMTPRTEELIDDMLETMYAENGCGLAAPQVGLLQRMVVIDIAHEGEEPQPLFLINPEIIWKSDEKEVCEEGCLSLPEMRAEVERPASVRVKYMDYNGKECELLAEDFLAVAMQHELDHLDGIYISTTSVVLSGRCC